MLWLFLKRNLTLHTRSEKSYLDNQPVASDLSPGTSILFTLADICECGKKKLFRVNGTKPNLPLYNDELNSILFKQGSVTAMTVFFPLDTARTRLQGWLFFCGSGIRGGLLKYKGRENSML